LLDLPLHEIGDTGVVAPQLAHGLPNHWPATVLAGLPCRRL
jgi:hypothetical protein